jgi:tetratricopeptide (TPR) repeat protein
MTTDPDLLPLPEAPAPDPLLALAMALDTSAGFDEVAALDPQPLTELAAMAVSVARSEPDTAWALRLDALRRVLMMQNMRPQYALVLAGMADVAEDLEDWPGRVHALDKLLGARDLLKEPWKAQATCLELARAQELAGEPALAEMTLLSAVERARKLAPAGNLIPASARAARALTHLGQLHARQGKMGEARAWLEGAVDMAPDPETQLVAEQALAALGEVTLSGG